MHQQTSDVCLGRYTIPAHSAKPSLNPHAGWPPSDNGVISVCHSMSLTVFYAKHHEKQEKLKCIKLRAKQFCVLALASCETKVNYKFLFAVFIWRFNDCWHQFAEEYCLLRPEHFFFAFFSVRCLFLSWPFKYLSNWNCNGDDKKTKQNKNKLFQTGHDKTLLSSFSLFLFSIMNDFPNVWWCVLLLTTLDIIIKQIRHGLMFTVNNLGLGWGDVLCKTQTSNENSIRVQTQESYIIFSSGYILQDRKRAPEQSWRILGLETALARSRQAVWSVRSWW